MPHSGFLERLDLGDTVIVHRHAHDEQGVVIRVTEDTLHVRVEPGGGVDSFDRRNGRCLRAGTPRDGSAAPYPERLGEATPERLAAIRHRQRMDDAMTEFAIARRHVVNRAHPPAALFEAAAILREARMAARATECNTNTGGCKR